MSAPQHTVSAPDRSLQGGSPDPRPDTAPDRAGVSGTGNVRRGTATGRVADARALPPRWFPADRAKLIYLSIAAHAAPQVLTQLVALHEGTWFEDRDALHRALAAVASPAPGAR